MKKILVTGGSGFIGSHTVVELINAGFSPIIIDSLENSELEILDGIEKITGCKIPFYKGDCCNYSFLEEIVRKEQGIEGIIHFAAYKAVGESVENPLKYYNNNINSLLSVLQVAKANNIKNFVFSSSCTVYGEPDVLPVTEKSPVKKANSPYGFTKQVCEEIIKDFSNANPFLTAISLRYFNPIGAHPTSLIGELPIGTPNNLVPFITQTAIGLRDELKVFGSDYATTDGTCTRDYIHVVDLAQAHVCALSKLNTLNTGYSFYNVGTGLGTSVLEVIASFEKVSGMKLNWHFVNKRPGDVASVYADATKIQQELNWSALKNLDEALLDAWNWQLKLKMHA
jgi:UDP-glucose 4-epimerase